MIEYLKKAWVPLFILVFVIGCLVYAGIELKVF